MVIARLLEMDSREYPAGRTTKNLVGGTSPIQAQNFSMGYVVLQPHGGQVPWHCHQQEEVYLVLEGEGEMCIGEELSRVRGGEAVYIPASTYHQLTNTGSTTMKMIYCYGPAGEVDHWRQELEGTLPRAGMDAPDLPEGSRPQHTTLRHD